MTTLLKLDSSPMGDHSISRKLTRHFVDTWRKTHPDATVISRDLAQMNIPTVDPAWIAAIHTPDEVQTPEQQKLLALSNELIAELHLADEIVLGSPMHNFNIPSALKLWIDQVVRAGKTFRYTDQGPVGLLSNKKVTLLIASGAVFAGTGIEALNFIAPYLRTVFSFIGISDVTLIPAEGTAQLRQPDADAQAFLAPVFERVAWRARQPLNA